MGKRVLGVFTLLIGLALTVLAAVSMAFKIPGNFTVAGDGVDWIVGLVTKYGLRTHVLLISLGLGLIFSSVVMFIAPRKRKVRMNAAEKAGNATATAEGGETAEGQGPALPVLIRVYHARVLATAFANPGGRLRQQIVREAKAGDVVACRSVGKPAEDGSETVGVFSVKGEQMGVMDATLLRAIRETYPSHRIGVTVERVTGGHGVPYTCHVRVGVYRA